MRRDELDELQFIAPITNAASILDMGILSHNRARRLDHESVADEEVQDRRRQQVPNGRRLHDHANLYINARNGMMYRLVSPPATCDVLCVSCVSPAVLDLPGVVIADCNAFALDYLRFADVASGLALLDYDEVFARSWDHPALVDKWRHRSRMQAEALVPDLVESRFFVRIKAGSAGAAANLSQVVRTLPVVVDRYLFFQGEP